MADEPKRPMNIKRHVAGRRVVKVGDAIRDLTHLLGLRPCPGCQKRQVELNRLEIRL